MLRTILVALVALLAVTTSGIAQTTNRPATPARPTLKSEAIINGEIVRIGDLIENAGIVASVPIFRAPDLGCTGTVSADTVLDAVRKHALIGVETAGLSEVVVTRASRTIPTSDLEEAIKQTLSTRYDLGATKDILVNFTRDTRTIYVDPSAKGEPRVTQIDFDSRSGRFDAVVEVPAATGKRSVVPVSGRAAATVEVATSPAKGADMSTFKPDFAAYQVVVSNYNGEMWPEATREAFEKFVKGGGGFVSVHAADNS